MRPMRRLARHLFMLCSAASLVLCVAVCALWARSYVAHDAAGYARRCTDDDPRADHWVYSTRGRVSLQTAMLGLSDKELGPFWNSGRPAEPYRPDTGLGPVAWEVRGYPSYASVSAPHWLLALALSVAPAAALGARVRRARRRSFGLCPACGYDLRASPERCPECGAAARTGA